MQGTCLKFYVHENRRHDGRLLYDWLLKTARELDLHGGSVFRAIAGFGRHGTISEQHFFELADDLPVEVVFVLSDEEADRLLERIQNEKNLALFYVRMSVEYGVLNGSKGSGSADV